MYILARVSDHNAKRLKGIAKSRNTTVAALSGALLAQYLSGKLKYVTAKKNAVTFVSDDNPAACVPPHE